MKNMEGLMGYAHPLYALSLKEFGDPRQLPRCGGWILVRQIPGTPYEDAMGCYPLFACQDWAKLHEDLEVISSDLISITLVTDPFCGVDQTFLEGVFDIVKPFKSHYVVDLSKPLESFVDKIHLYNARRSLKEVEVFISLNPLQYLGEWGKLYDHLILRHGITGINAFSKECFELQLQIPGTMLVIGKHLDKIVGANLIIIKDDLAYGHLAAFSPIGYKKKASYGIYWTALQYLRNQNINFYDMGGGAGLKENVEDGLLKFKRGWANERRTVYFCGRIFARQKYEIIAKQKGIGNADYFPAYRSGEFA